VITVLLPVHNGANYLAESIASVLAQDSDFALHVLDDGSTDATPAIAQSTGDPRVRYSKNPRNLGLYQTLNRGFSEATSAWVRLWAHDDRMPPGSLGRFAAFAAAHPSVAMVYSDFLAIDAAGRPTGGERAFVSQRQRTPEVASGPRSLLLFWCYGCLPGNISTVMLRRDVWQALGGFQERIQQAPDYDMWTRVAAAHQVGFLAEKLVELRDHPLQLGRLGAKQMTTIEEELPVITRLESALRGLLTDEELALGWRSGRGIQHVQWIARALLRGDVATARRGWRAVKRYGQPLSQVLFWLRSANGRIGVPDRDALFDRAAARLG
jgi:glycosyltransferase involved in cell wall biosynthesis